MTDCALRSRRPPAEKLPSSAAAMNMRRWSSETLSSIYRLKRWIVSINIGYHDLKRGHIVLSTNSQGSKSMTVISVIVGSTREGRFSEKPAKWILQHLMKRESVDARLLDLRDFPMPFFD